MSRSRQLHARGWPPRPSFTDGNLGRWPARCLHSRGTIIRSSTVLWHTGTGRDDLISEEAFIYLTTGRMGRVPAGCVESLAFALDLGWGRFAARSCSCDVTMDMRCIWDVTPRNAHLTIRRKATSSCVPEKVQAEQTRNLSGWRVLRRGKSSRHTPTDFRESSRPPMYRGPVCQSSIQATPHITRDAQPANHPKKQAKSPVEGPIIRDRPSVPRAPPALF